MPDDPYAAIAQTDPYAGIAQAAAPSEGFLARTFKSRTVPKDYSPKTNPGTSEGAGLAGGLAEWDKASGGEIAGGVSDIFKGDISKGLHRILSGAGNAAAPVTALVGPATVAAAPLATALSAGASIGGGKLAQKGAEMLGASPDQATLAGDIGSIGGAVAGGAIPNLAKRTLLLGRTPQSAYESALKPSTTLSPEERAAATQTGLENEIPVSKAGLEKLGDLIDSYNDKISARIKSGASQGATVNPKDVAARTAGTEAKFATQVTPESDLQSIQGVKQEFLRNNQQSIPLDQAQAMKQGTYRVLAGKYGEQGSAAVEAQKALARGLKEEIASAFPEINDLNAAEGKALDLQPLLERAVGRISNHQMLGIGTPITIGAAKAVTGSNKLAAVAGLLKGLLDDPIVKSRLAISLSKTGVPYPQAVSRIAAYQTSLAASSSEDKSGDQASQ